MSLILLGVNHKTAPIELRERIAIPAHLLREATQSLAGTPGVKEAMIVSTCNRVELLAWTETPSVDLQQFLNQYFSLESNLLKPHVYEYREREAVRHIFRVAASLDSMVVGEPQILGQVKDAYTAAREAGTLSGNLERLLGSAFATAKKVRTETQIGQTSVSIASVAVDLAQKIFGSLEGKKVFLVGAGKMSELAARHLIQQGAGTILVSNRTHERAVRLAQQFHGQVIQYEELHSTADQADIIITSTGAPHPIFTKKHGQLFMQKRRNRPMFFIDIAVPRDVEPEMNRLEGIFVYDIDDLQSVAASHLAERSREAELAERIVAQEVEGYQKKLRTVDAAPAIVQLQQSAEAMRRVELERFGGRLQSLTPEQYAAVEALTRGLMNKLLHHPMTAIKSAAREGDGARLNYLADVFQLESKPEESPASEADVEPLRTCNVPHDHAEDASQAVPVGQSPSVRKG